jgi:hypothetical protein
MIKMSLRRLAALTATTALAASLAACGPGDAQQNRTAAPLLSQAEPPSGWSMDDLAGVDPTFLGDEVAPLPPALPMQASYRGDYDYAPAYDYGPDVYDEDYYADDASPDDYQWLALASALSGMLGNAPPDYAFGYDGVQPWAWETGDRYLRYAEPLDGGYRYYYYEPDSYTPFLVSDPYYSYGYRGDRLVAIYDRSGRVIDARRAERQRQAVRDYYVRARQMYLAAHQAPRTGVAAPLWQRHREDIARQRQQWNQARSQRAAWQRWDAQNEQRLHRDWAGEALVRREAEQGFAGWQKAGFKTQAPKLYSHQQRKVQVQKLAEIRRDEQRVARQRAQQQQAGRQQTAQRERLAMRSQNERRDADVARGRREQQAQAERVTQQRQAQAQRAEAQQRQVQAKRAGQQRQAKAEGVKAQHQRQAQAQRAKAQQAQAERAKAQQAQAQRAKAQQQAQRTQVQRQAQHEAGQRRQQAAREHQLEAQRATQRRQAQASRAVEQKAGQARAAQQRQHAQQAQRAAQQQAQRAAQQQAQRAARQQAQRAAAQQQAQARQAAQRQAQQARAAQKQPSGGQAQQAHGNGHGRKDR